MGGWGSGRQAKLPIVEDGLSLKLSRLLQDRTIINGQHNAGSLTWTYVATGEKVGAISYEANLVDPTAAWVRLHYTVKGVPQDYRVWLETTRCHFGGYRWWWNCPRSGRRARVLYLPPGESMFVSRQVYGLPYRSQRESQIDRSHARQRRLYEKLGGEYFMFEDPPPGRPKGMHRRTYARRKAEIFAAMDAHDGLWLSGAIRFQKELGRIGP